MQKDKTTRAKSDWWNEEYGFFGDFYIEGDDSKEGYMLEKLSLIERTEREVSGIVKLLDLKGGETILDIPCGYGRHSIELAKKGFQVVGSDINSRHLRRAIEAAEKAHISVDFRRENMLEIEYENEFDRVINLFYSFGFFETDDDNLEVLQRFYKSLKVGGEFLMHTDVNIPRILSNKYKKDEVRHLSSGGQLQIVDRYDPLTKRVNGTWIITRSDGRKTTKQYSVRVYEKNEFIDLCLQVGFKKCDTFGDWQGNPYNEESEDIIFVTKK
ncbi:SAM-dependent methyltransferase [Patescibacteria group bacterium]